MQRYIGWGVIALGAFLLMMGALTTVWAPDVAKRTPIDNDTTTRLTGTAAKLNPITGQVEELKVKVLSVNRTDTDASTDDVAVWTAVTCVMVDHPLAPDCSEEKNDPNIVTIPDPDVFATDRRNGMAVDNGDFLPAGSEQKEGLVNKFPFDTEKKDYDMWDGMINAPVPATYEGSSEIDGLEVYEFHLEVTDAPAEVVTGVQGFYSMDKTMWIEPRTGKIIDQVQHEVRTQESGDPVIDMEVSFTDEQVAENVADAEDNLSLLNLITRTLPLIGWIGGVILLVGGVFLALRGKEQQRRKAATA